MAGRNEECGLNERLLAIDKMFKINLLRISQSFCFVAGRGMGMRLKMASRRQNSGGLEG
jgi:hypothetical protein